MTLTEALAASRDYPHGERRAVSLDLGQVPLIAILYRPGGAPSLYALSGAYPDGTPTFRHTSEDPGRTWVPGGWSEVTKTALVADCHREAL